MKRPQFRLRDAWLATTLAGLGLGCLHLVMTYVSSPTSDYRFLAYPVAIPLLTAGIAALFHRVRLGFYVGFIGQIVVFFGVAVAFTGRREAYRNLLSDRPTQVVAGLTAFVIVLAAFVLARRLLRFAKAKGLSTK